ncbi:MAG: hypothetical protein PHU23_06100 [Dehalococcoidales bacterium]|nr:hypothetical protein [Dehalococcoidales bacterium]
MMIWGIIWTWIKDLEQVQIILFGIAAAFFLIVIVRLIIAWWQRRNIERIPDLIEKLDVMVSSYIDDFSFDLTEQEWKGINRDYSNVLGIDLTNLEAEILKEHNKDGIGRAYDSVIRAYERKVDPENKTTESLTYLGDMGSILDKYNVGLNNLKETEQYQKLDKKIKSLQRKAPSAYISAKVNAYYTLSERLYILVLGAKPLLEQPNLSDRIPAKIYAKKSQIRPLIDGQIANLIAAVRESILKYKERNMGYQVTEQNSNSQKPQNRAERRRN